jgi:hypothetical protein
LLLVQKLSNKRGIDMQAVGMIGCSSLVRIPEGELVEEVEIALLPTRARE